MTPLEQARLDLQIVQNELWGPLLDRDEARVIALRPRFQEATRRYAEAVMLEGKIHAHPHAGA